MKENNCWICGAAVGSAEHIFKKKDMIARYGKPSEWKQTQPMLFRAGKESLIQGPNSDALKYEKSLCHDCNTTRTQQHDFAYDAFSAYILANIEKIIHYRMIDLAEIYGETGIEQAADLYRYFVKSFGCRAVHAGLSISDDIKNIFFEDNPYTTLVLTFSINEAAWEVLGEDGSSFLGKGDFMGRHINHDHVVSDAVWHENIFWITVNYWYNTPSDFGLGSPWIGGSRYLYFGSSVFGGSFREEMAKIYDNFVTEGSKTNNP